MAKYKQTFVIVGGGSAGWITANALLAKFPNDQIILIDDPNTPSIGVGEGSTPALKAFFELLNIPEKEWMPECDATYKNGIEFINWSPKKEFKSYFHAFPSTIDNNTLAPFFHHCQLRNAGMKINVNPSDFFLTAKLSEQYQAPKPAENFPFEVNYGYHFDSAKLAKFLHNHALKKGITHITGKVETVALHNSRDVKSLRLASGEVVVGDVFFDCSGFNSLIAKQVYDVPFISYQEQLLNDTAVVLQQVETGLKRESQTISMAMSAGWRWQIPLVSRNGYGSVFSCAFISEEQAQQELLAGLPNQQATLLTEPKFIKFPVGRLSEFWHNNCVAVGLSQGFVEPLEATALFLVQQTVGKFIDCWVLADEAACLNSQRDKFNNELTDLFDGIKDYIMLHYKLGGREDTDYWKTLKYDVPLPERLNELCDAWHRNNNFINVLKAGGLDKYYPISSWYSIFAGNGFFKTPNQSATNSRFDYQKVHEFIRKSALNYPDHLTTLRQLQTKSNNDTLL